MLFEFDKMYEYSDIIREGINEYTLVEVAQHAQVETKCRVVLRHIERYGLHLMLCFLMSRTS